MFRYTPRAEVKTRSDGPNPSTHEPGGRRIARPRTFGRPHLFSTTSMITARVQATARHAEPRVVPVVDGIAVATLGWCGYETMYPDAKSGAAWLEHLRMEGLQSETAETLGQVLEVAAELGAIDSRGLGLADRPSREAEVRARLERSFGKHLAELAGRLERFDQDLGERIVGFVATVPAGEVDYPAEVQDGLGGVSTPVLEEAGYLTLRLLEEDRAGRSAGACVDGPTRWADSFGVR